MKRVFLISFSTPILIDVARNLKERGIEIVFWQGYRDAFDELARSKAGFETTIFRHAFDAIKNIPPKEVDTSDFEPLSREIVESMYSYGWDSLSMMSRADYVHSPFVKRRHAYYAYVKFWHGMLKKFTPDAVVFISVPHSAMLFSLYGMARVLNIRTIILDGMSQSIDSRALILNDYQLGPKELLEEYERIKDGIHTLSDLSNDVRGHYLKQKNMQFPEGAAADAYSHLLSKGNKMPFRVPSLKTVLKHLYHFTFFKAAKSYLDMLFSTRKTPYYDKDLTGFSMMLLTRRWSRMRKAFEKEYRQLEVQPDYQKKYVYMPLAFQPEMTTCPMGGVFDDQLLMIDLVASALPDGWVVYVKEHLPQWFKHHTETHMYRYEGYYREIASKKNVYLIPAETHPYELIRNAQAVATTTGSTGWEAVLRSKPALVFGYVWYMFCEGVFRVSNRDECRDALEEIKQGYQISQQRVINYLAALDKVSVKAKHYKTRDYIKNTEVSMEENVANITEALSRAIVKD